MSSKQVKKKHGWILLKKILMLKGIYTREKKMYELNAIKETNQK